MYASRSAARASRALRAKRQQVRFQSSNAPQPATSGALTGAIAGGATAFALGYGWYYFSGTRNVVKTAKDTQNYIQSQSQQFKKQFQEKAPNPNEALRWLRQVSTYYAGFLPGASGLVNTTFDDLDKVRDKHGDEVDKIVSEAFQELRGIAQKGSMDLATAQQAWQILQKHISRIAELAGDAAEDIINNHPRLKETVGGNVDQLKKYADQYGPEARKAYEDAKNQISDIVKTGFSSENIENIRKLVDEKVQQVKQLSNQAWQKGLEQAQPYLEKNPKIKELVEQNADALKQGNIGELFEKVKSGNYEDLQQYVQQAKNKVNQSTGGGLDKYLGMIPGGSEVFEKLQQFQEVANQKGPEAEQLLKDTVKELSNVLSRKSEEAKKLGKDAADKSS